MRRLKSATAAVALLMAATAGTAPPAEAGTPAGRYANAAVKATNNARANHDLKELRKTDCLKGFAVQQARRMANQKRIFHQELGAVGSACKLTMAAENVASGYRTGRSVVRDGWMNSEGHRANILSPAYRIIGIGARKGDDGRWYVAQVFGRKS